jgi:hypothetical protein
VLSVDDVTAVDIDVHGFVVVLVALIHGDVVVVGTMHGAVVVVAFIHGAVVVVGSIHGTVVVVVTFKQGVGVVVDVEEGVAVDRQTQGAVVDVVSGAVGQIHSLMLFVVDASAVVDS